MKNLIKEVRLLILRIGVKQSINGGPDEWRYRDVDRDSIELDQIIKNFLLNGSMRQLTLKKSPAMEVDLFGGHDETSGSVPQ